MNPPTETRVGSPAEALRRWPADRPVAAVLAGDRAGRSRFSLLAEPERTLRAAGLDEALSIIGSTRRGGASDPAAHGMPVYTTGWIASIPYAAGFELEPKAASAGHAVPAPVLLARVERGWVHDNRRDRWHPLNTTEPGPPTADDAGSARLGPARGLDRWGAYERAAARVVKLIRAGDAFQVNLAHRLWAEFEGSPRAVGAELTERLGPWHGCYIEHGSAAVASVSPELFLDLAPAGRVTTRPMKGTRAGHDRSLGLSPKDAAELAMIVDLMRNDLGRVCRFGSVRVTDARSIEPHGGTAAEPAVWQGVATVEGALRAGETIESLLRATLPPGSITGAPKVRAMQIIDELEPALGFDGPMARRGPYCGACGFFGDNGSAVLNVAIRTAVIEHRPGGGVCHYPVGAGIVADSDPADEWAETLTKARPFLELCGTKIGAGS
ncbi:MAG: anthranilate synthase component I family protein [Planctomycetota bacterium]